MSTVPKPLTFVRTHRQIHFCPLSVFDRKKFAGKAQTSTFIINVKLNFFVSAEQPCHVVTKQPLRVDVHIETTFRERFDDFCRILFQIGLGVFLDELFPFLVARRDVRRRVGVNGIKRRRRVLVFRIRKNITNNIQFVAINRRKHRPQVLPIPLVLATGGANDSRYQLFRRRAVSPSQNIPRIFRRRMISNGIRSKCDRFVNGNDFTILQLSLNGHDRFVADVEFAHLVVAPTGSVGVHDDRIFVQLDIDVFAFQTVCFAILLRHFFAFLRRCKFHLQKLLYVLQSLSVIARLWEKYNDPQRVFHRGSQRVVVIFHCLCVCTNLVRERRYRLFTKFLVFLVDRFHDALEFAHESREVFIEGSQLIVRQRN
mmetsp:Transcript_4126/g.12730  ORF Transcript_4126/g.12730 Transcript_4126/m.12730 type:complete len:370 (+) Transcript_4126:1475-2584(+)